MKLTISENNAHSSILTALDLWRGIINTRDGVVIILFMLIWAKYIPQTNTKEGLIGFFDLLETFNFSNLEKIEKSLRQITKCPIIDDSLFKKLCNQEIRYSNELEVTRSILIPAAKLIAKGNEDDIEYIISIIHDLLLASSPSFYIGLNQSIINFCNKIFDESSNKSNEINCLFQNGIHTALFAKKRKIFLNHHFSHEENISRNLISLYGDSSSLEENFTEKDNTITTPAWGISPGNPNLINYDLFKEEEDSRLFKDPLCKMIYLAHKYTRKTTIAIAPLTILFSKAKGTNHFRKTLIEKNWIDSIIILPNGVFNTSNINGALLILKKKRDSNKVQFIDFSNCEKSKLAKRGKLEIPTEEINNLFKICKSKKKNEFSNSISIKEIANNDYDLNFNKYLLSEEDKESFELINCRDTEILDSLVNFIRPLPILKDKNPTYESKEVNELNEVMISDINYVGEIIDTSKKTDVSSKFLSKAKLPFVKEDDLIISIKGTLGKIGIIKKELPNTVPGPSLCILRIKTQKKSQKEFISDFIFQYLRSDIGQRMIYKSSQGVKSPFISINDLKNLKIPLPSEEEKKKSKNISKKSKELILSIQRMQKELDECTANGWLLVNKAKKSKDDSS